MSLTTLAATLADLAGCGAAAHRRPSPPPGLGELGDTFIAWMTWILRVCGVAGLMACGVMMAVGRRNRSAMAADGAAGIPWVLGGLTLGAVAAADRRVHPARLRRRAMTIDVIAAARRRTRRLLLVVGRDRRWCSSLRCIPPACTSTPRLDDRPATADLGRHAQRRQPAAAGGGAAGRRDLDDGGRGGAAGLGHRRPAATASDGLAAGFAHTPAGAVLAAVHLLVRTTPQVGLGRVRTDPARPGGRRARRRDARRRRRRLPRSSAASRHGRPGRVAAGRAGRRPAGRLHRHSGRASTCSPSPSTPPAPPGSPPPRRGGLDRRRLGAGRAAATAGGTARSRAVTPAQAAAYPPLAPGR